MTAQDRISLLLTFIIGAVAGAYLYVTGFAPTYKLSEAGTSDVYQNLIIKGESYGSCSKTNACLVFQVLSDGVYRTIIDPTGQKIANEGTVSRILGKEIQKYFIPAALQSEAALLVGDKCRYGEGETNYRFTIELDNQIYKLDTCKTDINYDGAIWATLVKLWSYLTQA